MIVAARRASLSSDNSYCHCVFSYIIVITVSATDFIFVKICDFSTQGWNFPKTYMHPC